MLNIKKFFVGIAIKAKSALGADTKGELEVLDSDGSLNYHNGTNSAKVVTNTHTATLSNKTINAPDNTITNIANANINASAAIDASKIANGAVSNAEFQYLDGVTSAIQTQIDSKESSANKGIANGYAPLDSSAKISSTYLPSYVDDVLEYANLAAFPVTGEAGKIYVALDTNKTYRWSGSAYIEISPSEVNSVNGYTGTVVLTKSDVGLSNVDNTSDANKPISTATQTALNLKADSSTLNSHISATSAHGVAGLVVGTTDTQTLTNKTIDASSNTLSNIVNSNISASAAIVDTKLATISTANKVSNSATTATNLNTASAIVARDSSGNFTANVITASLSGNATSATTATNVTTNANLTGPITSVGNATSVASQTGTGSTFVMATSPTITTPVISSITNTGTITLPTATTTLVGTNTTDTLTNKSISGSSNTITNVSLTTAVTGTLPIANGGTNATSLTSPVGSIAPLVYFDGTRMATDTTPAHLGYNATTDTVYTSALQLSAATTNSLQTTNTATSSSTAGAGISAFSDDGAALASGDRLGFLTFGGSKDASHTTANATAINSYTTEAWGTSATGAKITFETTPNGSTTRGAALTINQDKSISVAGLIESTVNGFKFPDGTTMTTAASGSGTGSLNTIFQLKADESIGLWSTGNNATFLGGGTISGTFSINSSTPLQGANSYQYVTSGVGSANDYFVSANQAVDIRFRGQQVYLTFPYSFAGNATDIKIVVYDATNSTIISSTTDYVAPTIALGGSGTNLNTAVVGCIIPSTCANIRVGFQFMIAGGIVRTFQFDSIQLSTDIYAVTNVANITDWISYTPTFVGLGTVTSVEAYYRRVGANLEVGVRASSGTVTAVTVTMSLPSGLTIAGTSAINTTRVVGQFVRNAVATQSLYVLGGTNATTVSFGDQNSSGLSNKVGTALIGNSEAFAMTFSVPILGWDSYNTNVVTPLQQVSSDTMSFVFQSTALTGNEAVGTFNTYTYAANTNTATIATSAPTQTTASMNVNGVQVFARAINATSTSASPCRFDIFLGKGLKSKQVDAYVSVAKVTSFGYDRGINTTTSEFGTDVYYSETTGILTINAGVNFSVGTSTRWVDSNIVNTSSAYFVINASKSPSLAAIMVPATPTIQKFTSGSGTYTPSSTAVKWIKVRMIGGGGGGGAGQAGGAGSAGGTTSFNSITAIGGTGGNAAQGNGNTGTVAGGTGGAGTAQLRIAGAAGANGGLTNGPGGGGGVSLFGGAAPSTFATGGAATAGAAALANSGSGGAGAWSTSAGGGGGAGEYVEIIQKNPTSYSYAVGAAGTGGTAGGAAGGAGGSGYIEVTEYYI